MNRATQIILEWAIVIEDGFGHNDEIHIYTGEEIYNDLMDWCEDNPEDYDLDAFSILMVKESNKQVDYELIASIITEYKKKETLEVKKEIEEEMRKAAETECH